MQRIVVAKHAPLADIEAEDTIIEITGEIPCSEFRVVDGSAEQWYTDQAEQIVSALFEALPQGTLDRVLGELITRKAELYQGRTGG